MSYDLNIPDLDGYTDRYDKEAPMPASNPSDAGVTVKVQIPVEVTTIGQYGRDEKTTRQMTVKFDGSRVTLLPDPAAQAGVSAVSFPWQGIEAAIAVLGSLK